jgi:hypothetical protein
LEIKPLTTPVKIILFVMAIIAALAIWSIIDPKPQQELVEVINETPAQLEKTNSPPVAVQSLVLDEPRSNQDSDSDDVNREPVSSDLNQLDAATSQAFEEQVANAPDDLSSHPGKQPLPGLDLTPEQWDAKRTLGGEAEAFLLPDGDGSQMNTEQLRYASQWKQKTLANQQRIAEIESDARRLDPDFIGLPSIEKQESVRVQGEEAERLLAPYESEPQE